MQEVSGVSGTEDGGFPVRQANKPRKRPGDTAYGPYLRLPALTLPCVFGPDMSGFRPAGLESEERLK